MVVMGSLVLRTMAGSHVGGRSRGAEPPHCRQCRGAEPPHGLARSEAAVDLARIIEHGLAFGGLLAPADGSQFTFSNTPIPGHVVHTVDAPTELDKDVFHYVGKCH